ncbi:MAG: hypothetical protein MK080_03895 [Opitutales bacterium]|nr:hypothetical protein [Opitutales bacterium]NRA25780.1 hypothetical protein [Opitutales bacterium]
MSKRAPPIIDGDGGKRLKGMKRRQHRANKEQTIASITALDCVSGNLKKLCMGW